jgi:ABC-2 type transport system ATP-binding protein
MIEVTDLTKTFGSTTAVDHVSFTVRPGMVTGFLGPNGAGKSTTMRMIVGLNRPTTGEARVNGVAYRQLRDPLRQVGILLDAKAVHTGRSARDHLAAMGATHGIGRKRVDEVIGLTGLQSVARKRVGGFSLGMGQRLGIAAALLGDPQVLILDEPVNGLDPEGVVWVRTLARHLAGEGRTVFLSSHLMSEMAQTADHIIVLGRGRVIADAPVAEIVAQATGGSVRVRTPQADALVAAITAEGGAAAPDQDGALVVTGIGAPRIGELAAGAGVVLHELSPVAASLEQAYLELTQGEVQYASGPADTTSAATDGGAR